MMTQLKEKAKTFLDFRTKMLEKDVALGKQQLVIEALESSLVDEKLKFIDFKGEMLKVLGALVLQKGEIVVPNTFLDAIDQSSFILHVGVTSDKSAVVITLKEQEPETHAN